MYWRAIRDKSTIRRNVGSSAECEQIERAVAARPLPRIDEVVRQIQRSLLPVACARKRRHASKAHPDILVRFSIDPQLRAPIGVRRHFLTDRGGKTQKVGMARSLGIEFTGAFYHVMAHGNRRGPIFEDVQDRNAFLRVQEKGSTLET